MEKIRDSYRLMFLLLGDCSAGWLALCMLISHAIDFSQSVVDLNLLCEGLMSKMRQREKCHLEEQSWIWWIGWVVVLFSPRASKWVHSAWCGRLGGTKACKQFCQCCASVWCLLSLFALPLPHICMTSAQLLKVPLCRTRPTECASMTPPFPYSGCQVPVAFSYSHSHTFFHPKSGFSNSFSPANTDSSYFFFVFFLLLPSALQL